MKSISLVPIQIYFNTNQCKKIIWQNPIPSFTRYCCPIKFCFAKECPELIRKEVNSIEDQIRSLSLPKIYVNDMQVFVKIHINFLHDRWKSLQ